MKALDNIRQRLEAATPGPWTIEPRDVYFYEDSGDGTLKPLTDELVFAYSGTFLGAKVIGPEEPGRSDFMVRDAWFIAHAPADIDRLIRALEKAVEQRDVYRRKYWETMDAPDFAEMDDAELENILEGK